MSRSTVRTALALGALLAASLGGVSPAAGQVPLFTEWRSFGTDDGLPSDTIYALAPTEDGLWIGTERGLAFYRDGRFTTWGVEDGLAYPVITSLAVDPATGDLWVGTLGGVSVFSGGRFESFDQRTSGLANDVVYSIAVAGRYVWAATAAGASRYDTWSGTWEIFTNRNAPMHEIWCYGLAADDDEVYMAVWGGGVLRFDRRTERWREFRDPDGEMELDLLADDGPVSDVVASVAYGDGVLWAGTYFGANRYDGRRWSGFSAEESGLPSNFVNWVLAEGRTAWFATDRGLSHFDGTVWTNYLRGADREGGAGGTITVLRPEGEEILATDAAIPNDFVLAVARRGDELWVGTEHGLGLGLPASGDAAHLRPARDDIETTERGDQ